MRDHVPELTAQKDDFRINSTIKYTDEEKRVLLSLTLTIAANDRRHRLSFRHTVPAAACCVMGRRQESGQTNDRYQTGNELREEAHKVKAVSRHVSAHFRFYSTHNKDVVNVVAHVSTSGKIRENV
jgi:hypothetical protein